MVKIELRTIQSLIGYLLSSTDYEWWLNENRHLLQFDQEVMHAHGLQRHQWAEGRIHVRFQDQSYYFTSDLIFGLQCYAAVRNSPMPTGVGNH
jgi:hypothetical protein